MPATQAGSTVLVTGANGFVAMWVVRKLLEEGYHVRGTIRSASKGDYMRKVFEDLGDKLELVVVPDIEKEGAFDEAVKGVDAVVHMASPYHFGAVDPAELIDPAIRGTLSILQSALKYGTNIRRIVITTSTAAMVRPTNTPIVFTEDDWNDASIQEVKEKSRDAPGYIKYFASKTLAERAAFDFVEKNKESIGWDLVTIAPPYPMINELSSPSSANASLAEWYQAILESAKSPEELKTSGNAWADVRDIALAHVRAIQQPEAEGRITVSADSFNWHDWVDVVHSLNPSPYPPNSYVQSDPSYDPKTAVRLLNFDTTKARRVLGIDKYISMEQSARDMLEDFRSRGW
ncbi:unnamed protein product [Somion occarium]|uniref:NAD-dependent epimerase/dehydratase domain-containing protein n=1 Tax=Somion occarium TaxID=3059160 RepID=A0ABP1DJD1_9APHY